MKQKTRTLLILLLMLVLLALMAFCGYKLLEHHREEQAREAANAYLIQHAVALLPTEEPTTPATVSGEPDATQPENPQPTEPPREKAPIQVDFEALWQESEDIAAWLYCPDTVIHYPIMYSGDNETYLYRLPNGNWNRGGSLFLDYRSDPAFGDYNSVVYGHNMKDDSMFGTLMYYRDPAYFEAHPVLYLLTPHQYYKVEVAALVVVDARDELIYSSPWELQEQQALLDYIREQALYDTGVALDVDHALLTLSTCVSVNSDSRYVLIGRMTEVDGAAKGS